MGRWFEGVVAPLADRMGQELGGEFDGKVGGRGLAGGSREASSRSAGAGEQAVAEHCGRVCLCSRRKPGHFAGGCA